MLIASLQCHWLISLYRDLQKYPCFCGFEWCTLRFFFFFKLRLPCFLRLLWTNSFQGDQFCAFYAPTFGFSYPLEALSLCTPCWALFTIFTFAGKYYGLYLLLVRATGSTHCWYVLQVVAITRICLQSSCIIGTCYACIHKLLLLTSFLVVLGNFCSWPISEPCI